jgi:hypothetical protein
VLVGSPPERFDWDFPALTQKGDFGVIR